MGLPEEVLSVFSGQKGVWVEEGRKEGSSVCVSEQPHEPPPQLRGEMSPEECQERKTFVANDSLCSLININSFQLFFLPPNQAPRTFSSRIICW